jgi:hypothetical protein
MFLRTALDQQKQGASVSSYGVRSLPYALQFIAPEEQLSGSLNECRFPLHLKAVLMSMNVLDRSQGI